MKLFILFILLIFVSGCSPQEDIQTLLLERVIDGDTFVASGKRVRLWGIDAPEKNEPEAYAATMYLEVLLEKGELKCLFLNKDKYKRDVMKCAVNGHDIASDLVMMGMARDYKKYSKGYYSFYEKKAKANRLGIWSGSKI